MSSMWPAWTPLLVALRSTLVSKDILWCSLSAFLMPMLSTQSIRIFYKDTLPQADSPLLYKRTQNELSTQLWHCIRKSALHSCPLQSSFTTYSTSEISQTYSKLVEILQIHTHIHTYIHAYIHTYMHTYIHTYIHTCIHTYIHAYIPVHTYIHTYIHTYVRTYTFVHSHLLLLLCLLCLGHSVCHSWGTQDPNGLCSSLAPWGQ